MASSRKTSVAERHAVPEAVPYVLQVPSVSVKMPMPTRPHPVATTGAPLGSTATAPMDVTPQCGKSRASWETVTSEDQCDRPAEASRTLSPTTAATALPAGPEASASGSAASAVGRSCGLQARPPLLLRARGENLSSWLGRNPTTTEPAVAPVTRPPLSATPRGVTTDQCVAPGAA